MRPLLLAAALVFAAAPALAQSPSADAAYGSVSLAEYFTPDPHRVTLTAGGSIDVDKPGCSYGFVANAPDYKVSYTTSGDSDLYIYARSSSDTTILVNLPNGRWACDDDSGAGNNPVLRIPNAASGRYDIWVGTYGDDMVDATLMISEVDPR